MGRPRVVQLGGERSEPPHASTRRSHRRPPVSGTVAVVGRRAAADGSAARPARADRVLGLLPPELDPDAALHEGVARALQRRRPARDRRARQPGSSPPRIPRTSRRRWRGWRFPTRWSSTWSSRSGRCTATSDGRPGISSTRAGRCSTITTARARMTRQNARSRSCSASRRRSSSRSAPRTRPAPCWSSRATTSTGPTAGPTRPEAYGRSSTATARSPRTADPSTSRTQGATS